jgi:hypothetical protein
MTKPSGAFHAALAALVFAGASAPLGAGAEARVRPRATLGAFAGPNARQTRDVISKTLAQEIELVPQGGRVPQITGRVVKEGNRLTVRLAVHDLRGKTLTDQIYDLSEPRLYRTMPGDLAVAIARAPVEVASAPVAMGPPVETMVMEGPPTGTDWAGRRFRDLLSIGAGAALNGRSFELAKRDANGGPLPVYAGAGTAFAIDLVAYPAVWIDSRRRFVRNIGGMIRYEMGPGGEVDVRENGNKYSAGANGWEVGPFYRLAVGPDERPLFTVRPMAGLGGRSFSMSGDNPPIPSVSYGYTFLGIDLAVPLPVLERRLEAYGSARRLFIDETEGVGQFGNAPESAGYAVAAGVTYKLPYRLDASLLFTQTSIGIDFAQGDAIEGRDRLSGFLARVSFTH